MASLAKIDMHLKTNLFRLHHFSEKNWGDHLTAGQMGVIQTFETVSLQHTPNRINYLDS